MLGEFEHGEFIRVSDVDGAGMVAVHQADHAFDVVVAVAEGAGLRTVAVDSDVLAPKSLHDEVGNDTTVVGVHAWAVGVEDAHDADVDAVLAFVVHEKSFGAAFAFVVARTDADGIDVAPIVFFLRMNQRIAVDFRSGGLENAGLGASGKTEHSDCAHHRGLHRLDGIVLVVNGRGGAGEIVDLVDLEFDGVDDVVSHQLKVGIVQKMSDVLAATGEVVVEADDFVAGGYHAVAEVAAEKSGFAGDEDTLGHGESLLSEFYRSRSGEQERKWGIRSVV